MSAAAATADTADAAPKKKGKKLLFVIIGVLVLAIAGAGGALFILKKNTADDEYADEEDHPAEVKHVDPKHAPTFLPLENMVVNLADPGGNRYIQIGLTLQLQDAATGDAVKAFMPSVRSQVLMLLSKRTSEEVLSGEGKEKLNKDIIAAVSETMGYEVDDPHADEEDGKKKKKRRTPPNPVQAVLFSSFIVQ
ncbi:MAG: flagellar basal body-associated FliL family protein [Hydrogenophaga sp.]|uniref:flagellar basal body-associated FliL family protein n=1 Tax=Hydrogenophaga sp. TaxID=1904254 RepID=UPI001D915E5F|nr:flagellar basal body-associated FliL family protein [Hydrogenophaga sp.]MBX3609669.1 flagellar basal body-associated FliL family protein [Hydrogenophaga sp.]